MSTYKEGHILAMNATDDRREGLRPPQFRLRTMLLAVAALSVLLALSTWIGPLWSIGLLLLALSVGAHVAGNAIGTRLREIGSRTPGEPPGPAAARHPISRVPLPAADFAPPTRLGARQPLGWSILAASAAGALIGGAAGGAGLAWLCWDRATAASLVCGAAASAALGGFFGFLVGSFVRELLRAHAQAAE